MTTETKKQAASAKAPKTLTARDAKRVEKFVNDCLREGMWEQMENALCDQGVLLHDPEDLDASMRYREEAVVHAFKCLAGGAH